MARRRGVLQQAEREGGAEVVLRDRGGNGACSRLGRVCYRLPTEAEWEYACRANIKTRYSFGNNEGGLGEHGWYEGDSGGQTHPVGQKPSNTFGLFDMHGNVSEWCWDGYGERYYQESPLDDPLAPAGAADRVIRGGSYSGSPRGCRSAYRYLDLPDFRSSGLGFRLARVQSAH